MRSLDISTGKTLEMRGRTFHNFYQVMGWPTGTAIPDELADWLAYLLKYQILDKAEKELNEMEVMTVRFNLGQFQLSRGITPLFSNYPQMISILKYDSGKLNIWVDYRLTSLVRDGYAFLKGIWRENYDRNRYKTSRLLADEKTDFVFSLEFFKNTARKHILYDFDD